MVEKPGLYKIRVESGAIDSDAVMVGVPFGRRMIEAPGAMIKECQSLIFWEPSMAEDRKLEFKKVVSYLCYFLS
jgi:hypothetical protein